MRSLARDELVDNRYRVLRCIGQGAWAMVYEAVDTQQDRSVALKILNDHLADNAELRARFVHEAEAVTRIDSPFIVGVHAVGTLKDGRPYIAMELLDGEDLGRRIEREGTLTEERAVELAINALSGLAHAHSRGVLHRDIKPDNLVIVKSEDGDEVLKIVDLGISKLHAGSHESLALTRTNVVLGSPVYMSPEQARGTRHMDHRSDVYSLGVVLYEALTGKLPHDGENFNEIMFKIALEDAPDPRTHKPDVNPGLAEIIMKALARDPDKRLSSASAFREALLEWGAQRGARIPPTPSSTRRVRNPISSKRLLVLDDDDDDEIEVAFEDPEERPKAKGEDKPKVKAKEASPRETPNRAAKASGLRAASEDSSLTPKTLPSATPLLRRPEVAETLAEGAVLVGPSLSTPPFARPRRRFGILLFFAAVVGAIVAMIHFRLWERFAPVPPPVVAAPPPPPVESLAPPAPPAPTASLSASAKRAAPSAASAKTTPKAAPSGAVKKPGAKSGEQNEGEETEEEPAGNNPANAPESNDSNP